MIAEGTDVQPATIMDGYHMDIKKDVSVSARGAVIQFLQGKLRFIAQMTARFWTPRGVFNEQHTQSYSDRHL